MTRTDMLFWIGMLCLALQFSRDNTAGMLWAMVPIGIAFLFAPNEPHSRESEQPK